MAKFIPKDRSGKPIHNYKKRHEFIVPGVPSAVKVPGKTSGDLEKALKIFKRQMKDAGTLEELRDRREFEKKSAIKRKQMNKAIRSQQKLERFAKINDKPCWTWIVNGQAQ